MDVGANIHRWRKRQGLTLEVLARGSGVSRAMLSDVERGRRSPTIKILAQIAVGLGCPVSALIEEPVPDGLHVERAAQHPVVEDDRTGVVRRTLSGPLLDGLELVWYELPAGTAMRRGPEAVWYETPSGRRSGPFPPNPHGTVEHVAVIAGRVDLTHGDATETLRTGDSANYRLIDELRFHNPGRSACRLTLLIDTRLLRRTPDR